MLRQVRLGRIISVTGRTDVAYSVVKQDTMLSIGYKKSPESTLTFFAFVSILMILQKMWSIECLAAVRTCIICSFASSLLARLRRSMVR